MIITTTMSRINPFLAYCLDDSSDEEMLELALTWGKHKAKKNKIKFLFEDINPESCYEQFRFHKEDLLRLCASLRIPEKIVASNGTTCSGNEIIKYLSADVWT